jgi:multiple sugar transport system ATP-binding protein
MPGQGSPATVEVVEHLGERTLIHARLRDGSILVYAEAGDSALRAGDAVAVQADGTTVHLFDSAGRAYHAG